MCAIAGMAHPQPVCNRLLIAYAERGRRVVRLKGGDPFVFGRGGEEALALAGAGVPFEVVPGVSAVVAVPAYAGIPVTHRGVASSFAVVTGHGDPSTGEPRVDVGRLAAADTVLVLMAARSLPRVARDLLAHGRAPGTPVAAIEQGTTAAQRVVEGTLADLAGPAPGHPFQALEPPVLVVIGEVVVLRSRLAWFQPSRVARPGTRQDRAWTPRLAARAARTDRQASLITSAGG